jgi:hypothetical protein
VFGAALFVLAARPAVGAADDAAPSSYRAVIDRVDLEPAVVGGLRLRVKLSALALQGQLIDLNGPKTIKLVVGGSKLEAPYALGQYGATNADTAIVIVVEANADYADALPKLMAALDTTVLQTLNDRTQLAILPYSEATATGKLMPLKAARARLDQVSADTAAGAPALLDTLDRAVLLLKRAKTPERRPLRKLIIVIGDGRDRANERDRVTQLGERADREGIRIHAFGYAPSKVLRPLLTLGELSKRSLGTFRYVRSGGTESWTPAFQQLRDEINKQYVLTYFLPAGAEVANRKLKVVTVGLTETTSNEMKVPEPSCGGEPCVDGYCADGKCAVAAEPRQRGVVGWLILVIGIALALVVVLGAIGFVLQKRQRPIAMPGAPGAFPPGAVPPGAFPPGALPPGFKPPKPGKVKQPKQPKQPPQPVVAAPPPVAPGPALLVISGPRAGERVALTNGFTIGKAPTSNLVIDDGYASTQHAQVGMDQFGNCRLYDRNSTNGTFANGVRVTEVVLDHGMSVRIGSTELRFLAQ